MFLHSTMYDCQKADTSRDPKASKIDRQLEEPINQ